MGIKENANIIFYKYMYKYVFNNSDVIYITNLIADDIKPVFNGNIHIVNNGIQDYFSSYKIENIKTNHKINILFVSNLIKIKGHDTFLQALAILNNKNIPLYGYIIGAESEFSQENLCQMIDKQALHNIVSYVGPKYNHEKLYYYAKSDIFIMPTRHEVFPGVVLEAMQFGIPVIATNVGGIPEIIDDGINGFIVDKDNPSQIAHKIELLINDKMLRKKMGESAREKFLKNYTFSKYEHNMKHVFNSILSNKDIP
jgi:glycosyltransferase involved in cell wall biosynthesis